jgi:hypothetical protein
VSDIRTWHRAPDTGKIWPREFFGDISYRVGNPFGDIRIAWEPARLQPLVGLALQGRQETPEARCAVTLIESSIHSWVTGNPPLTGIHYISAMECALRMIAVCYAVDMVRHRLMKPRDTWRAVVELVRSHASLIAQRLSLYSSSGNHTIAEGTGLVYAGILFQELAEAATWKSLGLRILEREAIRQVLPDGGGIEQAPWYHFFIIDLLGLVEALLKHRHEGVPAAISEAAQRGRRFLRAFGAGPEDLPPIGDSDNGYALSEHLRISWTAQAESVPRTHTFPIAGYTIVRAGASRRCRLVFDHGPLGMSPAYGHGHADALSVHLAIGSQDLLVDPGTYTYTGDQKWRRWFRGTAAHNTVVVDRLDQAVQETAFIWSRPYKARLVHREETPDGIVMLLARHDGYEKRAGVTHWRAVYFEPPGGWIIWDRLVGRGEHYLELNWHLGVESSFEAGVHVLRGVECRLNLTVEGVTGSHRVATTTTTSGWRSRHYGRKEPISTLQTVYTGVLPHDFVTRLWLDTTPCPAEPAIRRLSAVLSSAHLASSATQI